MRITKEMYTIATKTFPLKFIYRDGNETDILDGDVLTNKETCEYELNELFDEPEEYQILKVEVTYEF